MLSNMASSQAEYNAMAYRASQKKKDRIYAQSRLNLFPTPISTDRRSGCYRPGHTPKLNDVAECFPTPTATQYKGWSPGHNRADKNDRLDYTIEREGNPGASADGGTKLRLSPDWVELLMGWPKHWTDLDNTPDMADLFTLQARWRGGTWEHGSPRVTDNTQNRAARLKAIGNGQVPQCAAMAFLMLLKQASM